MATKPCKYCRQPIEWIEEDGRWFGYEPDSDERHSCEEYKEFKRQSKAPVQPRFRTARQIGNSSQMPLVQGVSAAQTDRLIAVLERIAEALEHKATLFS